MREAFLQRQGEGKPTLPGQLKRLPHARPRARRTIRGTRQHTAVNRDRRHEEIERLRRGEELFGSIQADEALLEDLKMIQPAGWQQPGALQDALDVVEPYEPPWLFAELFRLRKRGLPQHKLADELGNLLPSFPASQRLAASLAQAHPQLGTPRHIKQILRGGIMEAGGHVGGQLGSEGRGKRHAFPDKLLPELPGWQRLSFPHELLAVRVLQRIDARGEVRHARELGDLQEVLHLRPAAGPAGPLRRGLPERRKVAAGLE